MKTTIATALVLAALPLQASDKKRATDNASLKKMQGSWKIKLASYAGGDAAFGPNSRFTIKGNTLTMLLFILDEQRKFVYTMKVDASKTPKQVDLVFKGKTRTRGIYKIEGDTFTICLAKTQPTKFESKRGGKATLWVLERAPKK